MILSFRLGQIMEGGSLRIVDKDGKELPVSTICKILLQSVLFEILLTFEIT